ncbi:hypothetical protein SteCoe_15721 [Stentor coeruleus]|uniref:Uncharacterized protein n=1 Tax=Stentor coeruleus TaxID=5963 RepID=A0A1R2C2Z3_9CILI|nr:hypothetical protein SteCoe_15721 [Stentor coeruleus]
MELKFEESNKRYYNPSTRSLMEAVKKRKLNRGTENIVPSPRLIGPPVKEAFPWPKSIMSEEFEVLSKEARLAEQERQLRINKATYETVQIGSIKEIV